MHCHATSVLPLVYDFMSRVIILSAAVLSDYLGCELYHARSAVHPRQTCKEPYLRDCFGAHIQAIASTSVGKNEVLFREFLSEDAV